MVLIMVVWVDLFVAFGTGALAVVTYYLARTGIEEGKKERRRLRLKEKLQDLYSPLIPKIENIESIKLSLDRSNIKRRIGSYFNGFTPVIEFLASEDLKEKVAKLFKEDFELSSAEWNIYIDKIAEIIRDDFSSLIEEYNELTKK